MPIAVSCQCGKTLNVRDDLAGKAVKCPACQSVLRVPSAAPNPSTAQAAKVKPGGSAPAAKPGPSMPTAKPVPPSSTASFPSAAAFPGTVPASTAASRQSASMDSLYSEAGFEVKTGKFCPECAEALLPGAVLCTRCGYHLESGAKLDAYKSTFDAPDSVNAVLRKAEVDMARAKELQLKMETAGMPAWMMAMILFVVVSCTTVAVIAVNVSRRTKGDTVSFNAVATMFLLAGIAFTAVSIGSQCVVLYRAFKESPKQGMFVLLIPGYILYYAFSRFKTVGKAFIVCIITSIVGIGLFVLASMSNNGQL
jgi:hypothetical protein